MTVQGGVLCLASASPAPAPLSLGSMQLAVSEATAPSEVTRVTVSGPDLDSRSTDLLLTDGAWGGVIGRIPAGAHRSVLAQAFNSSNTLRYQGKADDVTVTPDTTGLVSLTLQDVFLSPRPPPARIPSSTRSPSQRDGVCHLERR